MFRGEKMSPCSSIGEIFLLLPSLLLCEPYLSSYSSLPACFCFFLSPSHNSPERVVHHTTVLFQDQKGEEERKKSLFFPSPPFRRQRETHEQKYDDLAFVCSWDDEHEASEGKKQWGMVENLGSAFNVGGLIAWGEEPVQVTGKSQYILFLR